MKILLVWSCMLAGLLIKSSSQQCLGNPQTLMSHHALSHLYSGEQEFSLNLLKIINQIGPQENIFFSPYSTYHALLLAYFISADETENYLKKALRLNPADHKNDIAKAYKAEKYFTKYTAGKLEYEFTSANRIYVTDLAEVRDCFFEIFEEEIIRANFTTSAEMLRNEINHWVENQTHDMIKDLLPPGSVDAATTLLLVNAAFFKGIWENKFDPEETKPEVFFVNSRKQVTVEMMHMETTLNYDVSDELQAHILELPYKGENISMFILLPPGVATDGVDTILKNLNAENFRSIVNGSLYSRQVLLSLPKFSVEQTLELVPILERIGVGNLFHEDADFSSLSGSKDLSLGRGIHKAKIQIDEEGTKAAAATVFFTFRIMQSENDLPVIFRCDKPFVYFIFNKATQTVMFMGVLKNPQ